MNINDDTILAFRAARDLMRLYDAYRSETRAQIAAMQQTRRYRFRAGTAMNDAKRLELAYLGMRETLAWRTDKVFAIRRNQIRRRLSELLGLPERS